MRKFFLAVLLSVAVTTPLHADYSGTYLLEQCSAEFKTVSDYEDEIEYLVYQPSQSSYCHGFMSAQRQMNAVLRGYGIEHLTYCPPKATRGQLIRVFLKHLEDNPKDLHRKASVLYMIAMRTAFPCKDKGE